MAATAAPPVAPARVSDDELIRETRERRERRRIERLARITFAVVALVFVAAAIAEGMFLHDGPRFSLASAALFVAAYAVVSHVQFEIGTGSVVPTQLVLVPMLFALPVGVVPVVVAAACVVVRPRELTSPERVLPRFANAMHALGPALVIAVGGGVPLRWSAWPVYVAALVAQWAVDFGAAAATTAAARRVSLRRLAQFMSWVYLVDAALAPIGLAIAFATRDHTWLVVLVLPLVALLREFAQERQRRIDHALELSDAYRGTAFLLGDVVEADHAYTGSHSRHVVDLVLAVGDKLGLSANDRRDAEFTALLHDVGKIRIPQSIIDKPGKLDAEERKIIETHTIEGEQMLERVGGLLGHIGHLVRSCHEHWDGGGYPDALIGEQIPLVARIVCACDAFSAMTTDRPYRRAMTHGEAVAELHRCAGTQFDPRVVGALGASV